MKNIIENAKIIYNNGLKEICDAISIDYKGVYTGQIKNKDKNIEKFINHSFIPYDQIKKIFFLNKSGKYEDIDFNIINEEYIK